MPKIKNWSRIQRKETRKRPYYWTHNEKNANAFVQRVGCETNPATGRANNQYSFMTSGDIQKIKQPPSTKERARKLAVKWMRSHPNG